MEYPATLNHDVGVRNRSVLTLQQVEEDVIDRIERAFAAAMRANTTPVCLEVTRAQYDELSLANTAFQTAYACTEAGRSSLPQSFAG